MSCWLPGPKLVAVELTVHFLATVRHAVSLPSWFSFLSVPDGYRTVCHVSIFNIASYLATHQSPVLSTHCPHYVGHQRGSEVTLETLCLTMSLCPPKWTRLPHGGVDISHSNLLLGTQLRRRGVGQEYTALGITIIYQAYCRSLGQSWKRKVWI